MVYDSVSHRPLVDAEVVLVGTPHHTTTNGRGIFRFDSLPAGHYLVGFFHPSLDSLGLSSPVQQVDVIEGKGALVTLTVPSLYTIVSMACPDSTLRDKRGMVIGTVRSALTNAPLPKAFVVARWSEVQIAGTGIHKQQQGMNTQADANGNYRMCGVPSEQTVTVQARSANSGTGWIELTLDPHSLVKQDFTVGEETAAVTSDSVKAAPAATAAAAGGAASSPGHKSSTAARSGTTAAAAGAAGAASRSRAASGPGVLTGVVRLPSGEPVAGALVQLVIGGESQQTDDNGTFSMHGLPLGTQVLEVRQVGYEPKHMNVDVTTHGENRVFVVLDTRTVVLDTVKVAAKTKDLTGFMDRKSHGLGTFITQDQIQERGPIDATDIFRTVPGVQVVFDGSYYRLRMARAQGIGDGCEPEIYMDGARFLAGNDNINTIVHPKDIAGIEVYKGASEVPIQYSNGRATCGVVLIWTRGGASEGIK